jgi:NAD(P)-dependent dehydrogenase (short-subunit alcohol dehydrogenase family)
MNTPRVSIITAASRGMGAAIARALAARGDHVALMSSTDAVNDLAAELDGLAVVGSVLEPDDLKRFVNAALERFGRIDHLVNNTGHPAKGDLLDITDDQWRHGLDIAFLNVVRMARLVTPAMLDAGGGSIVNISTYAALEPDLTFPVSNPMRAALASYTKLYADRYAADHIRMNSILPGFIDSYPEQSDIVKRIPMNRYGSVDEIAATACFLLSDDAGYITGQNLRVDGGISRSV